MQQASGMLSLRGCASLPLWRTDPTAPGTPSWLEWVHGENQSPCAEIQAHTNGAHPASSCLYGGTGPTTLYRVGMDMWGDRVRSPRLSSIHQGLSAARTKRVP